MHIFDYLKKLIKTIFNKFDLCNYLVLKNIALHQQVSVLKRSSKRPCFNKTDRMFWVLLSMFWNNWQESLIIVKPETVVNWHRQGFKIFWRLKSGCNKPGRPNISPEIRKLIKTMAQDNPLWGAPRIHGEFLKLGFTVSEKTVSNIIKKIFRKPPSQTWKTFLKNHVGKVSVDFLTVPTATFKMFYVFIILKNEQRKILHFNITTNPTAKWTSQQIINTFPWDTAPKYLMRDRDGIYGISFKNRIKNMGIKEVIATPKSPWQNSFVERVIGSIRRECLDHCIIFNERHLHKILNDYVHYYNNGRTHYNLDKDTPNKRKIHPKPDPKSKVIKLPRVGGLHHRYEWQKAA